MTQPPPRPDSLEALLVDVAQVLERCRRDADPDQGDPPAWTAQAATALAQLAHDRVTVAVIQTIRRATTAETNYAQLRDGVRHMLADLVAANAATDRDDANAYLRQFDLLPLQAKYSVTITATLTTTVTADDDNDAAEQAREMLRSIAPDYPDHPFELGDIHIDEVNEQGVAEPAD